MRSINFSDESYCDAAANAVTNAHIISSAISSALASAATDALGWVAVSDVCDMRAVCQYRAHVTSQLPILRQ
jgi:hypothetical protein